MLRPAGGGFGRGEMGNSFEPSCSPAIAPGAGKAGTALGGGRAGCLQCCWASAMLPGNCNTSRPRVATVGPAAGGQQPKEGAALLVLAPDVCSRVDVYLRTLLPTESGLNGEFFSKRQKPEAVILFSSDLGSPSCVVNLNRDFCGNRVAVEESSVQTPRTGTEERVPISSQIACVGVRGISKPSPFEAMATLCAGLRWKEGRGDDFLIPPVPYRVGFGTRWLRAAGFA